MFISVRHVISIFAIALTLLCACATPNVPEPPELYDPYDHVWPQDVSDLAPDPNLKFGELPNGFRFVLLKHDYPKGEISVRFRINVGSVHETEDQLGIAHFLEHMAFNGSENVTKGELTQSLQRLGLSLGKDANASTGTKRTEYRFNIQDKQDGDLEHVLSLTREVADRLLIDPEDVEDERRVVLAEALQRKTPERLARDAYSGFAFDGRLFVERPVIGSEQTITAITADDLRAFYETYYRPQRAFLFIVGDIDPERVSQTIGQRFSDWSAAPTQPEDPHPGAVINRGLEAFIFPDERIRSEVRLTQTKPSSYLGNRTSDRRAGLIKGLVIDGINRRLRAVTRRVNGPATSASFSYSTGRNGDTLRFTSRPRNDDWRRAIESLRAEKARLMQHGFLDSEFRDIVEAERRSRQVQLDRASLQRSSRLSQQISGSITGSRVFTSPEQTFALFEQHVQTVQLSEINQELKRMLQGFEPKIWIQGPRLDEVTASAVIDAFLQVEPGSIDPPAPQSAAQIELPDLGTAGSIANESYDTAHEIHSFELSNGIRLNIRADEPESNRTGFYVVIDGGYTAFSDQRAGSAALARLFPQGGTEFQSWAEIREIFDGRNVTPRFRVSSDHFAFLGSAAEQELDEQLDFLTAMIGAPGFREDMLIRLKDSVASRAGAHDASPRAVASGHSGRIWADGDERYGRLEPDRYLELELSDIESVMRERLQNGAIEIGVISNLDPALIAEKFASTLGRLPKRDSQFRAHNGYAIPRFPDGGVTKLTHRGDKDLAAVHYAWPILTPWTHEDSAMYRLLSDATRTRLFDVIRLQHGLTYSPRSSIRFIRAESDYGFLAISVETDTDQLDNVAQIVESTIGEIRANGFSPDEFERAATPKIDDIVSRQHSKLAWMPFVARAQSRPEDLGFRQREVKFHQDLRRVELNQLARELFREGLAHAIEIRPEGSP